MTSSTSIQFEHYHVLSGDRGYTPDYNQPILEYAFARKVALEWANSLLESFEPTEDDFDDHNAFTEESDWFDLPKGCGAEYVNVSQCNNIDCGIDDGQCIACDRIVPHGEERNPSHHTDDCSWIQALNDSNKEVS